MIKGECNLSRARGAKAQQRRNHDQQYHQQNIIQLHAVEQNPPIKSRRIELIPRTQRQEQLIVALGDPDQHIVIATGPAGTGKSYLAMLAALRDLRLGRVDRVVLTRPAVGVEDERHGFLPGDLTRKMEPWTRPLLDIMREFYHPREVVRMIEDEIVEIAPLAFMRGRTFKNTWIVADEMQNATPNQMKMLLTRIGSGSRIVVTGDVEQTDRQLANNGLWDLAQRLDQQAVPGISLCEMSLSDIQRHVIIDQVLGLYQG